VPIRQSDEQRCQYDPGPEFRWLFIHGYVSQSPGELFRRGRLAQKIKHESVVQSGTQLADVPESQFCRSYAVRIGASQSALDEEEQGTIEPC